MRSYATKNRERIGRPTLFTLVELLVVIAIIAVLASLLLPALHHARDSAVGIACMNKMRQYGMGFHMALQDRDETLPFSLGPGEIWCGPNGWATEYGLSVETTATSWTNASYQNAARDNQWYLCPALGGKTKEPEPYFDIFSYGMNISFGMTLWGYPLRPQDDLRDPSCTVLVIDVEGRTGDGGTYYLTAGGGGFPNHYAYRHSGGINVLFADGRVERRQAPLPSVATPDILWWF